MQEFELCETSDTCFLNVYDNDNFMWHNKITQNNNKYKHQLKVVFFFKKGKKIKRIGK